MTAIVSFRPSISRERMPNMKKHDLANRERTEIQLFFFFFPSGTTTVATMIE